MAEDESRVAALGEVDRKVRQWLKAVRLSVIAVVLEAIRDELESRARASGSRECPQPPHRPARCWTHGAGAVPGPEWRPHNVGARQVAQAQRIARVGVAMGTSAKKGAS